MRPRFVFRAFAIVASASITLSNANVSAADAPFPDMERSWYGYKEAASYLIEKGVLEGYPDGTFRPKAAINRAELLKIIFKARSENEPVGGGCFSDVPENAWFSPFVCAAKNRGIIEGYPDGTFKPEQTVNIAEAMKMVLLAYDREIEPRDGDDWYRPYANEFDKTDVLPRHSYLPWAPLNRERASDILAKFLKLDEDRVVPNESPGCGKSPRDVPEKITVNGVDRSFLLTTPRGYDSDEPSPLIVAFHGRTNSNERVRSYYGLDRAGPDYFIAYPAGMQTDTGTYNWSSPGDKIGSIRDVAFFDAIVETVGETYCIDLNRIFTVGHSLGAWMANSVACARGDVVRGSATVGGDSMIAPCAGPAAAMMIHNPHDTLASFYSTQLARDRRLEENSCGPTTKPVEPERLKCEEFRGCVGDNPVVWCPHEIDEDERGAFYPHQWPRGTGEDIVEFFDALN